LRELSSPGNGGELAGRDDDGVRFKEGVAGFEILLPRSVSSTNVVGIPHGPMTFSSIFHR
jgi:hypothetical protein